VQEVKTLLHETIMIVQLMKVLLEKHLLTEEGKIQPSSKEFLNEFSQKAPSLGLGGGYGS
jgi:hypothetical protein